MEKKQQRYIFIDVWKAIAILFVIFYHSFQVSLDFSELTLGKTMQYFFYTLCGTGVPAFFIINGFLMFRKKSDKNGIKAHYLKVVRIILKTGIWAVFTLGLLMIIKGDPFSIKGFIRDLIVLKAGYINHLWFMEALVFLYVVYPFLKLIYEKAYQIFVVITGFVIIYTIILPKFIALPDIYFSFSLAYFMAGGVIYKHKDLIINKVFRMVCVIAAVVFVLLHTATGIQKCISESIFYDNAWACYQSIWIFIAVTIIMLVLCTGKSNCKFNIIKKIGRDSLGIYFIHQILIRMFYMNSIIKQLSGSEFIYNFVFAIFILILSFCITEIIKKIPVLKAMVNL